MFAGAIAPSDVTFAPANVRGERVRASECGVVHESFVRVFERWDTVNDPAASLRRTVVNRCASWHRHRAVVRKTRTRVATDDTYLDAPDELSDALAQLPPRRRAIVVAASTSTWTTTTSPTCSESLSAPSNPHFTARWHS